MLDRPRAGETAVLIHLDVGALVHPDGLQELTELALSAGAQPIECFVLKRAKPDPATFLGKGCVENIRLRLLENKAQLVLINISLAPSQQRNLEKIWQVRVVDRIGLILDIFAQRARTHEGKLQVELAQMQYMSTRLVRGWTHLERQKGGIGLRGPGETQLETDRRLVRTRIHTIKHRLEKVRRQRAQNAKARKRAHLPSVALVGYTNAGKSTLFNQLAKTKILAKDQLFATLDPTLRRVWLTDQTTMILADTVGFIRDLPHELVDAFRATLEEVADADLLLHVIDASNPHHLDQMEEVHKVLEEIHADAIPMINVYNKIDATEGLVAKAQRLKNKGMSQGCAYISAQTGDGIAGLKSLIVTLLPSPPLPPQSTRE